MVYRIQWSLGQRKEFVRKWMEFRERYGLTQGQLAEEMGVHVNTVQRVETGKFVPNKETVSLFRGVERKYKEGEERARSLREVPGR